MGIRFRATGIAIGVLLSFLLLTSHAKADEFSFVIQGQFTGSGTFTTSSLLPPVIFAPFDHYHILSINGLFNNSVMTLVDPDPFAPSDSNPSGYGRYDNLVSSGGLSFSSWTLFATGDQQWVMFFNDFGGPPANHDWLYNTTGASPGVINSSAYLVQPFSITITPVATPEPAAIVLLGVGLLGLAVIKRRFD